MEIILICVLVICSNALFAYMGYKLAKEKDIITIQKSDTVSVVPTRMYQDFDEEATYLTPEMEQKFDEEYRKELLKESREKGGN